MGTYTYYRILDNVSDIDYIKELKIELITYLGDADLYISTSEDNTKPTMFAHDYSSERKDHYDEVTLTDDVNLWLASKIYIGVYAS